MASGRGSDGTVPAPDGSGRQVKLVTADDVVAYLRAHPDFFDKHAELAGELALTPAVKGSVRPVLLTTRNIDGYDCARLDLSDILPPPVASITVARPRTPEL